MAGSEPADDTRPRYAFDSTFTVLRENGAGQKERWTFPYQMKWTVPVWELHGLTRREYERRANELAQRRAAEEREWSRLRNARGGYPSGHGSSIHTVSGGLPGLGRRR